MLPDAGCFVGSKLRPRSPNTEKINSLSSNLTYVGSKCWTRLAGC